MTPEIITIFQYAGWSCAIWFMIRSIWRYDANEKKLIDLALDSSKHWEQCSSNYRSLNSHLENNDKQLEDHENRIRELEHKVK